MSVSSYHDNVCVIRSPHDIPWRAKRILVKPRTSDPVRAQLAQEDGETKSSTGEPLHYQAGQHYVVDGVDGRRSVVKRDTFQKTYEKVARGWFRKRRSLKLHAAVCDRETEVHTLEGVQSAHPGDLIMVGVEGEVWPVPADAARRRYEKASRMNWSAVEIALMTTLIAGYFLYLVIR